MNPTGRHRHPGTMRLTGATALIVALAAGTIMITSSPDAPAPASSAEQPLAQAYPSRKPFDLPATFAGGVSYTPLFFVDGQRFVATSPSADAKQVRLVLRDGDTERVLRELPAGSKPDFLGFTTDGRDLLWLELTAGPDGQGDSALWRAELSGNAAAGTLTTDTGDVVLLDAEYDMVLHDGRVSWVSLPRTDTPHTEIRTVPLTGGAVQVQTIEGAYTLAAWPWLVADSLGQDVPVELRNLDTGERVQARQSPGELVRCSPSWCRAVIIGSTESSTVIELMRPDGSDRFRTISGSVASSIVDVAVLGRYEVYSRTGGGAFAGSQVLLYDIEGRRAVLVDEGVGQVISRNGVLWWSTGDNETLAWHALDLRALTG